MIAGNARPARADDEAIPREVETAVDHGLEWLAKTQQPDGSWNGGGSAAAAVTGTAPDPTGATHWGQQTFYLHPPVDCAANDRLRCTIDLSRKKDNHRLLNVKLGVKVEGNSIYAEHSTTPRNFNFHIE